MSIITGFASKAIGMKVVATIVAVAVGYIGTMHLLLRTAKAERNAAQIEAKTATDANATNLVTIEDLKRANHSFAETVRLSDEAAKKLKERADEAQQNADRARSELSRFRALDRRAPDCAALLDRSLAACPDLIERLWPDADRSN